MKEPSATESNDAIALSGLINSDVADGLTARLETMMSLAQMEFNVSASDLMTSVIAVLLKADPDEVSKRILVCAGIITGDVEVDESGELNLKPKRRKHIRV